MSSFGGCDGGGGGQKPPSSDSLGLLSAAPLAEEWNKENLPVPGQPGESPKHLVVAKRPQEVGLLKESVPFASPACAPPRPPLSSASPSPSNNLLKRPLPPPRASPSPSPSPDLAPFSIKRRKGILERSLSVEELDDKQRSGMMGAGASPDLMGDLMASPVARPVSLLGQQKRPLLMGYRSSPSTPLRRGQGSSGGGQSSSSSSSSSSSLHPILHRSFSANHAAQVKRSFELCDRDPNLTGDSQRRLCLPLLTEGLKHPDLKTISAHTLARLLRGEFDGVVGGFRILDARYAYEFEGGHIRGAENYGLWDEKAFFDEFLPKEPRHLSPPPPLPPPPSSSASRVDCKMEVIEEEEEDGDQKTEDGQGDKEQAKEPKRNILIFHCEFSSARGPALMKELRKK